MYLSATHACILKRPNLIFDRPTVCKSTPKWNTLASRFATSFSSLPSCSSSQPLTNLQILREAFNIEIQFYNLSRRADSRPLKFTIRFGRGVPRANWNNSLNLFFCNPAGIWDNLAREACECDFCNDDDIEKREFAFTLFVADRRPAIEFYERNNRSVDPCEWSLYFSNLRNKYSFWQQRELSRLMELFKQSLFRKTAIMCDWKFLLLLKLGKGRNERK